jgi:hypothetical protein
LNEPPEQGIGPEYILGSIKAGHSTFSTNWMIAFTVLPSGFPELREVLVYAMVKRA